MRSLTFAMLLGLLLASAGATEAACVELADGQVLEGQFERLDEKGASVRLADGQKRLFAPGEVSMLNLSAAAESMQRGGQEIIKTAAGDILACERLAVKDGKVLLKNAAIGDIELPLSAVRTVLLPPVTMTPADIEKELAKMELPAGGADRLVVRKGESATAVEGTLLGIDSGSVGFRWSGSDRQAARDKVMAVVLAEVQAATKPAGGKVAGRMTLSDGSRLGFSQISYEGQTWKAQFPLLGARDLPVKAVAAVVFESMAVNLSQIKPSSVSEHGYFDRTFNYRVDRSVSGGPIRLAGKTYSSGLGLHAYCELTYALAGQYSRLAGTAGIDDAATSKGDSVLTVEGDGKVLAGPLRLRGGEAPQMIRAELKGVKRLVVRVDFGPASTGAGDHVDLAGMKLIR